MSEPLDVGSSKVVAALAHSSIAWLAPVMTWVVAGGVGGLHAELEASGLAEFDDAVDGRSAMPADPVGGGQR